MLWLVFCMALNSYAQTIIKGKVTDVAGQGLPGATVTNKQDGNKSTTNDKGEFSISVKSAALAVLNVAYVGYKAQDVALGGKTNITIKLLEDASSLTTVEITGAMGVKRTAKSITYAAQKVDVESLTEARDLNIVNGLAGKVAGIQVTNTGQPGSSARVILRGEGSVSGNNQPLWVVDGVPISNEMGDERGDNLDRGNGAADLNPDDIESIEVLKGPNGAALYGSRAANGAILITTKKGKFGDKTYGIAVNQNTMLYTITEFPEYQNVYGEGNSGGRMAYDVNALFGTTGAINMGTYATSWGMPMLGQPFNTFSGQPHGYVPQPGNIKALYQSSVTNVSSIAISKADATSSFRLSYTYTDGTDVIENQNLKKKHNVNLFATKRLGDRVSVDARVLYTNDVTDNRSVRNLSAASPQSAYVYMTRSTDVAGFTPWKDANGDAIGIPGLNSSENPYWSIYENSNQDAHTRLIGGISATVDITKELKLRSQVAADLDFAKGYIYNELGGRTNLKGNYSNSADQAQNWTYETLLTYNKTINKDFKVSANLGGNISTRDLLRRTARIDALLVHDRPTINNKNANPEANEAYNQQEIQSIFGTSTISFKNLLFLDITARNDWSSTLPASNRSFFYPSIGTSFVFSDLIKKNDILTNGKVRASWAKVGNSAGPYQLIQSYTSGTLFLGNPTLTYDNKKKNADLKPEQKVSIELGTDLSFFKNRLSLAATFYKDNTTNQILTANAPSESGFSQMVINAGEVQNKGVEITLSGTILKTKALTWTGIVNYSKNESLVKSLNEGVSRRDLGGGFLGAKVQAVVGMPYGIITGNIPYMVGDKMIVSDNGRLVADPDQIIASYRPKWLGSFGSGVTYKGFDLSFLLTVKYGGNLYVGTYGRANFQGTTVSSLAGRDEWLFSKWILGESGDEQKGLGQAVGTTRIPYADSQRPKGLRYPNSYFQSYAPGAPTVPLRDENGRLIPGGVNTIWGDPQLLAADFVQNNVPALIYDATSVRISELVFGYTVPSKLFGTGFIRSARLAAVARNPFVLYKRTPQGVDPDSANTTGNAQGIEAGGSFPYTQYGLNLKFTF